MCSHELSRLWVLDCLSIFDVLPSSVLNTLAPCRWAGWQPKHPIYADLRGLLLYSATRCALKDHFQLEHVRPEDMASAATADALFLRLLVQAHSLAELKALQTLLDEVWDSGKAFYSAAEHSSGRQHDWTGADRGSLQNDRADSQENLSSAPEINSARLQPVGAEALAERPAKLHDSAPVTGEQSFRSHDSAPGTPPAEESRWATSASFPDAADGWDDAELLLSLSEEPVKELPHATSTLHLDAADGWDGAEQLSLSGEPAITSQHTDHATDGWGLRKGLTLLAQGDATAPAKSAPVHGDGSGSQQRALGETNQAASPATGPAAVADGWDLDEGLALSLEAQDAGSAQASSPDAQTAGLSKDALASDSVLSNGPAGRRVNITVSAPPPVTKERIKAPSPRVCIKHGTVKPIVGANSALTDAALAAASLSGGTTQTDAEHHLVTEPMQSSRSGNAVPIAREIAVPMHACWAVLLQQMLTASDRELAGCVLARLEKAGFQNAVLVSEIGADDLVAASETAGK